MTRAAERMAEMRARRRAALRAISGTECARCRQPVWGYVKREWVPGPRASRGTLSGGPSDRGLSSRPDLLHAALVGRVGLCMEHCLAVTGQRGARVFRSMRGSDADPQAVPRRRAG